MSGGSTTTDHGLSRPNGDPGSIRTSARSLSTSSDHATAARGQVANVRVAVEESWMSDAASEFGNLAGRTDALLAKVPHINAKVSKALHEYADALEKAQKDIDKAEKDLERAEREHTKAVTAANKMKTEGEQELHAAEAAAKDDPLALLRVGAAELKIAAAGIAKTTADTTFKTEEKKAKDDAQRAGEEIDRATATCTKEVEDGGLEAEREVKAPLEEILHNAAAAGAAFAVGLTAKETGALVKIVRTLRAGDADAIAKLSSKEFAAAEKIAATEGSKGAEALAAWLNYQARLTPKQLAKIRHAIDAMDPFEAGATRGETLLNVLGKLGLAAGAADALYGIIHGDTGKKLALDIATLTGTSLAAVGTETANALLEGLIAANVLDEIPVVGEAILLTTAVVAGGMFLAEHWKQVTAAVDAVEKGAGKLVETEIAGGKFVVHKVVDGGKVVVRTVIEQGGKFVETEIAGGKIVAQKVVEGGDAAVHWAEGAADDARKGIEDGGKYVIGKVGDGIDTVGDGLGDVGSTIGDGVSSLVP